MKTFRSISAAALLTASFCIAWSQVRGAEGISLNADDGYYPVDPGSVTIRWEGAKAAGDGHYGTLGLKSGTLEVNNGKLISGEFILDMNNIVVLDIENEGMNRRLVNHLRSEDFFNSGFHPEGVFRIQEINETGSGRYLISGELTIKGITHPVNFTSMLNAEDGRLQGETETILLDRTKWRVNYQSKTIFAELRDSFIKDEIKIEVSIDARLSN